ncbi:hypothetical protein Y883_21335, partial [Luteibacter rhizovicinus DSM 16549]
MAHVGARVDGEPTATGVDTGVGGRVEYNIEGNPFAGPRGAYPGLIELAREVRPTQGTLVPDGDGQITSEHGFDLPRDIETLKPAGAAFR